MGKTLTFKSGYDAQSIISRSDIGNLTDNGDGTIDATDVDTTRVRNVLGENNNNVGLLCTSSKINMWALFKPGRVSYDGNGNLFHDKPDDQSGYKLGDFLGYNHDAKKPEVNGSNQAYHEDDSSITLFIAFSQKEFNWDEMPNISHFYVVIQDGSTTIKEKQYAIDYSNRTQTIDTQIDVSSWTGDKTLTIELWVGTSAEKKALIDTGEANLNYKELTYFAGPIGRAQDYPYVADHDDQSAFSSDNTYQIDIYLYDTDNNRVSDTIDIDVYINNTLDHTKTGVGINYNDSGGTRVTGSFSGSIDKYGDTWSMFVKSS